MRELTLYSYIRIVLLSKICKWLSNSINILLKKES